MIIFVTLMFNEVDDGDDDRVDFEEDTLVCCDEFERGSQLACSIPITRFNHLDGRICICIRIRIWL